MTKEKLRELAEKSTITINGRPAKIVNWDSNFPEVVTLSGALTVTYSLAGIEHNLVKNKGAFRVL